VKIGYLILQVNTDDAVNAHGALDAHSALACSAELSAYRTGNCGHINLLKT
jgi:hypothetical protein